MEGRRENKTKEDSKKTQEELRQEQGKDVQKVEGNLGKRGRRKPND